MNPEIALLREVCTKVTQMLAGMGIMVTQRGTSAFVETDGRTLKPKRVNIPYIPDNATEELILGIQGFIDHEVAHIIFTDWAVVKKADRLGPAISQLHNIVEDTYIERAIQKKFPGSVYNLAKLHHFFLEHITKPALDKVRGNLDNEFGVLLVPMMRAWSGQKIFADFLREHGLWVRMEPFVEKIGKLALEVPKVQASDQALDLAIKIDKALNTRKPKVAEESKGKGEKGESAGEAAKPSKEEPDHGDDEGSAAGAPEEETPPVPGLPEPGSAEDEEVSPTADEDEDEESVGARGEDEDEKPHSGLEDDDDDDGDDEGDEADDGRSPPDADADEGEDGGTADEEGEDEEDGDASSASTAGAEGEDEDEAGDVDGGDGEAEPGDGDDGHEFGDGGGEPEGREPEVDERAEVDWDDEEAADGAEDITPWNARIDAEALKSGDFDEAVAEAIGKDAAAAAKSSDYRIFSKDFDRIETFSVSPSAYRDEWLSRLEDRTRHMVGVMQKDIERMMAARSMSVKVPGFRSGKLHSASLHKLASGDSRVFRRKQENVSKDVVVSLLVDCSGSMGGSKIDTAMSAAFALSGTLERVGIKHECLGFTTDGFGIGGVKGLTGSMIRAEEMKIGTRFSRIEPLYFPIFKGFEERLTSEVKRRFAAAPVTCGLANNVDGESVEFAAWRLLKQQATRRVLMVLSDGQPAAEGDSNEQQAHLRRVVKWCGEKKIETIGIGILSDAPRHYYPKSIVLRDLSALPLQVMAEIKRILT